MCQEMGDSLADALKESNELLSYLGDNGNSMLHLEALAGNAGVVKTLLDYGANPKIKNHSGQIPLDLAKLLNWEHVITLLER